MSTVYDEVGQAASSIAPTLRSNNKVTEHDGDVIPEVATVSLGNFKFTRRAIVVTLETIDGGTVCFSIKPAKFLTLISIAVMLVNMHLGDVFQAIGL